MMNFQLFNKQSEEHKLDLTSLQHYKKNTIGVSSPCTNEVFKFDKSIIIEPIHGQSVVILTSSKGEILNSFILDDATYIAENNYFNVITLSEKSEVILHYPVGAQLLLEKLDQPIGLGGQTGNQLFHELNYIGQETIKAQSILSLTKLNYSQLIISQDKALEILYNKEKIQLDPYQAMLIPAKQPIQLLNPRTEDLSINYILFTSPTQDLIFKHPKSVQDKQYTLLNQILKLTTSNNPFDQQLMKLWFAELFIYFFNSSPDLQATDKHSAHDKQMYDQIINFMYKHLDTHTQVNDILQTFNISRSKLQNIFKQFSTLTPLQTMSQIRLQKSKALIEEGHLSMTEIAETLSYGSIQYFSRAFSKEFGLSPSAYQKQFQESQKGN